MKTTRVDNKYYRIDVNDEKSLLYLTLLTAYSDIQIDKNIVNNILSFCMQMPDRFNFIVDLRLFDPRIKSEWFQVNMDRIGKRMNEISAGPQAHILNDIFWYKLYNDYPQTAGMYPVIIQDENTKDLIGRFSTIKEGEEWLATL